MRRPLEAVIVFLPPVALLIWVIYLFSVVTLGSVARLKVQAYDPRDLLSGHYLQYSIDYGDIMTCDGSARQDSASNHSSDQCVCLGLETGLDTYHATWAGECRYIDRSWCPQFLRGECRYSRFEAGIERFYIPEEFTPFLTRVPDNSTIQVSIDEDGKGLVTDFFVGAISLADYVKTQSVTPTSDPVFTPEVEDHS